MSDQIEVGQVIYDVQPGYGIDAFKVTEYVVEKVTAKTVKAQAVHGWTNTFKKDEMGQPRVFGRIWHTDPVEAKKAVIHHLKSEREQLTEKASMLTDKIGLIIADLEGGAQ